MCLNKPRSSYGFELMTPMNWVGLNWSPPTPQEWMMQIEGLAIPQIWSIVGGLRSVFAWGFKHPTVVKIDGILTYLKTIKQIVIFPWGFHGWIPLNMEVFPSKIIKSHVIPMVKSLSPLGIASTASCLRWRPKSLSVGRLNAPKMAVDSSTIQDTDDYT